MAVGQLQWKEQCQSTQAFPGLNIVVEPYKLFYSSRGTYNWAEVTQLASSVCLQMLENDSKA